MKKSVFKTILIACLPLLAVSCIDNVPDVEILPQDPVSFNYEILGDYALDYYIDSDITFTNTSPTAGEAVWDFGDGKTDTGNEVVHSYDKSGTYQVKLTVGGITKSQVIMIADIKPLVSINPIEGGICEVGNSKVSFSLELPNPKNRPATFKWIFPKDTKDANGEVITEFYTEDVNELPGELVFSHVGSQQVKLQVELQGRALEAAVLNVQVGYDKPVPTLYYAVQGGRIMAFKLTQGTGKPETMEVAPYDLGVSSGQHPFNILFHDTLLYVLDAGKQFYYVNDVNGVLGDGKISVIAKDGSKVQTMISNANQAAFDDPFYGCIEGTDLYYSNRNTGIIKVPLSHRDKLYSSSDYPYFVQHATLGYYNNGFGYGAIGGMFGKINGVWHWTKFYNGNGIYRFMDADILSSTITQGNADNVPFYDKELKKSTGIMLTGMSPKSFVQTKGATPKFCFHIMDAGYNGIYAGTYEEIVAVGESKSNLKPYAKTYNGMMFESNTTGNVPSIEGSGSEPVGICQMTYDEVNDCVYFAYRNNSAASANFPPTGIYCYNVATDEVTCLIEGVSAYGVAVNNTPSKLF